MWRWIVNALAVLLAAWLVPGITVTSTSTVGLVVTVGLVALILGAVNTIVKPVAEFFSGCFILLTLGLFVLVINGLMLMLTSWLATQFGLGFHVDGFWSAFWGAVVISIVSMLLGAGNRRNNASR